MSTKNVDINVLHLRNDNEKVFQEIVKSYWPRLYKFSQIYVVDKEAAKEIVQDTFMTLWNKRKELKDDTDITGYLLVVNKNRCLNYLRDQKLETMDLSELSDSQIYQRSNKYVLENESLSLLITQDLQKAIDASLNKLPPKTKEIFMQSRLQGLQNKEIAELQQLSVKSIEFHITKALKQLQSDLSPDYFIWFMIISSLG